MSQPSQTMVRPDRVVFELDRFALTRGDRCVVEGRWYGVRGRRFMRPTLTVIVEGEATHLLADLEHKPWAAQDGERWRATFPFELEMGEVRKAELTVAPDITIPLPDSGAGSTPKKAKPTRGRGGRSRPPARRGTGELGDRGGEASALTRELSEAREEKRRLARQLDGVTDEKAQLACRLDELLGQLSHAVQERDEARADHAALAAQLEAVGRAHGQIAGAQGAAERARDEIAAELDATRRASQEATRERDTARLARDRALADRDAAIAAQGLAETERDTAAAAREEAVQLREALANTTSGFSLSSPTSPQRAAQPW
jgi:hypothetical protein